MEFYGVEIPLEAQPSFVLRVEQEELGIAAGLQDRVIQVYEGLVYMDFDRARERVVDGLPVLRTTSRSTRRCCRRSTWPITMQLSEPTEVFHNDIRARFNRGEAQVVDAMTHFAGPGGGGPRGAAGRRSRAAVGA